MAKMRNCRNTRVTSRLSPTLLKTLRLRDVQGLSVPEAAHLPRGALGNTDAMASEETSLRHEDPLATRLFDAGRHARSTC